MLRSILALRRRLRQAGYRWVHGWRAPEDADSLAELLREPVARDPSAPRESPASPARREPFKGPTAREAGHAVAADVLGEESEGRL